MDSRIGELNGGKFYAYVNGYSAAPVVGTLEQVEVALGLREVSVSVKAAKESVIWNVTMTFECPSWSTVNGIQYKVAAVTKSAAIRSARIMAQNDGHAVGGVGRYWFKADAE